VSAPAAAWPGWARRAACLLAVLLSAKLALIALRSAAGLGAPLASVWTLPAFVYQDLAVATAWAVSDLLLSRLRGPSAIGWTLYAGAVVWTAVNVPAAALFSSPLTRPILAAAGGALADSIRLYLTARNLAPLLAVLAIGALAPLAVRRLRRPSRRTSAMVAACALALGALGPLATGRVDALGLYRNALVVLLSTTLRQHARGGDAPAALPPIEAEGEARDLSALRGAARGQSVLWVILESTGAQYLAPWGAPRDPMPTVSALAKRGLVFDAIYAVYPESIKGLFSALCSRAPAAYTSADRYTAAALPCPSLPERFAAAGYRTALFHSGRFVYLGMRGVVAERFGKLADAGDVGGKYASSFGVDEASTVRALLGWIDTLPAEAPFFAVYAPITGHHPYHSPGEGARPFGEAPEQAAYASDLYRGDLALADLLAGLARRGLDRRTLVVLSGDHGEAFQQHPGNFGHTLFLYEENLHVPLVLAGPAITLGGRAPQVGSLLDLAPTLLELAGLEVPAAFEGRSLLAPAPGVARFFTDQALWQLGLRTGRWKLIYEVESGRSRLFDLSSDPGELRDLSAREPARAARYAGHLLGWSALTRARLAR